MFANRIALRVSLASILAALALAGCGSVKPPPGPTASRPPSKTLADQRSATPAALASELQWLQSWFKDTPVNIRPADDGALSIEVPRAFCFDPGSSAVKPALATVLDKLAESLRRVPLSRVPLLAAPDDAAGTTPLALQRATQVRQHLGARGVATARLGPATATAAPSVQLRVEAAAH